MGAAAQLKCWTPGLMIESPNLQKLCAASAPFFLYDDLQNELDAMKAALRQHIRLSPLDTSKDLLVWTDAAPSEGMCYVLAQWKNPEDESLGINILSCDSTTFNLAIFSCAATQYVLLCVCLFVCVCVLGF